MVQKNHTKHTLVLIGILLLLVSTYPMLSVANKSKLVAGFPVLYLYLFTVWLVFIILLYRITRRKPPQPKRNE
ncbi:MAG TPA: hypothetical protein PLC48_11300 [Ferruginibacter sp.]|nr:hypothetical protein [Ferruginibacter sp.]